MNKAPTSRQIAKYAAKNLGKFAHFLKEAGYYKMPKGLELMTMSFAFYCQEHNI